MTPTEWKERLIQEFSNMTKEWKTWDNGFLILHAEEIASAQLCYEILCNYEMSAEELACLSDMRQPLAEICSRWIEENGSQAAHEEDMRHVIFQVQQDQLDLTGTQGDQSLESGTDPSSQSFSQ